MTQSNRDRNIILAARIMSLVFTPFYLPLVGLMALFMFSYLGLMPWAYKLQATGFLSAVHAAVGV